jgi:acyl-coenzyme A thioesterase PaaI-like protein
MVSRRSTLTGGCYVAQEQEEKSPEAGVESLLKGLIPLYRHIDLVIECVRDGEYRCRIPLNEKTRNHFDTVHAAIQFASAEVLGGLVVQGNFLADRLFIAVLGVSIEFERAAKTEIIAQTHFGEAEVAAVRRDLEAHGEARFELHGSIRDTSDREVATTVSRYLVRPPRAAPKS